MDDKVCLRHPDRPATSRCTTCFTPLCDECIHIVAGQHFCSGKCARNCIGHQARIDQFEAREKERIRRGIRRRRRRILIAAAILAAAGYAGWHFRGQLAPWAEKIRAMVAERIGHKPGPGHVPRP